ncbi:MAG TPA: Holliday junction branch migration protein RuvA [candidate division WOR-3 bacterium]|uniref:Holliday junction branch migration complex subunit RuvA n=1 Tax=candidate division WOR-3 bacterium TaxID=2052148 RepID=A0A7V0XFY4_UNCW3|nr:Holliday junction branch migration protein RuvA [candidate division WOR-3 bacterium]
MIALVAGRLAEKEPTRVMVDCRGIGFELRVPLSTSNRLGSVGEQVSLLVVPRLTREGMDLFGFLDPAERDTFRLLLSVTGIGPKAGLNILSRFSPDEVRELIAAGRADVIRTVPGIGPKRAERVLRELAEKSPGPEVATGTLADAESALVSLGLTRREARARLGRVPNAAGLDLAALLRFALQQRD